MPPPEPSACSCRRADPPASGLPHPPGMAPRDTRLLHRLKDLKVNSPPNFQIRLDFLPKILSVVQNSRRRELIGVMSERRVAGCGLAGGVQGWYFSQAACSEIHQSPAVKYIEAFSRVDFSCRVHVRNVP